MDSMFRIMFCWNISTEAILQSLFAGLGFVIAVTGLIEEKHKSEVKYSFHFKTLLMMRYALDHEIVSLKTILTCVSILIKLEEFEIAARVLESGTDDFWRCSEIISFDYVFASVVSYTLRKNLRELADLSGIEYDAKRFKMSTRVFFLWSLYVCYKHLGQEEKLQGVLTMMYIMVLTQLYVDTCIALNRNVFQFFILFRLPTFTRDVQKYAQMEIFFIFVITIASYQ